MPLSFLDKLKNPNSSKILKQLHTFDPLNDGRITLKTFALKLSGNSYDELGLISTIKDAISDYVFGTDQKLKDQQDGKEPYSEALSHFGGGVPLFNGKYGELLLYLLVESVLEVPMVCHKIQSLSNGNDQVKGGDGVFLGMFNDKPVKMIGEAKIRCDFSLIVPDFISSLEKYHENIISRGFELLVAQRNLTHSLNNDEIETVKKYFDATSDEYKQARLIHPVLLVYKDETIEKSLSDEQVKEIENNYVEVLRKSFVERLEEIKKKVSGSKNIKTVELIIFLIPLRDTKKFRFDVFAKLHGLRHHQEQDYLSGKIKEEDGPAAKPEKKQNKKKSPKKAKKVAKKSRGKSR